ncbi:peptidyl-prolyl cis-trans isomerase PASTICCINO1 [Phalaenopsis equestris]|uniref:peptidyl-prolyl cis-trans isomerase PASTICCINO1 n=1 Tax=Phalaenopsis equestris TaxID=78828 RepID=UPI0009E2EE2C|nr:peptidyl-prolyl cis-trans isomerase PASTICCINO1 [Phalaenopsis equestris]
MKAMIRSGVGTRKPLEGDQVIFHCTIRTLDGVTVNSTRLEHGGKGYPNRYVLGMSKMLLGLCEGIPTMLRGEVAVFKMKPELHYAEVDCPVTAPDDFPKDVELHFEIELLDFFKAKIVSEDMGVVKKIIDEGQGWECPREPYEVEAWITAKAADGNMILPRMNNPYHFTFGKSEIPKGVEMGIGTMTKGEKAVIYVNNGYLSESSLMQIPEGHEEVQFEVELIHFTQVRDMLGDGRLIKRRIRDGKGEFPMDCPLQDSLLRVHYKGMLLDEERFVFYDTRVDNNGEPLEFCSGEGLVPEGFEMSVRLMLPGEISIITCPPDYAYDRFKRPANVPEGAHVQWEIELLGFEMPKDWTGLNFQNIMDEVEKIKSTGNRLFKEGKYELAKAKYEKVLREYNHVNPQDDEEGKIFLNSRNALHLNVAACYQKMGEYRKSIETCNKVLDGNPVHAKAIYRRGMAYMLHGDFEEARKDFNAMISMEKSSESDANAALQKLKQLELEAERKARKQFKGLFDKKPGEISGAVNISTDNEGIETQNSDGKLADPEDSQEGRESSVAAGEPVEPEKLGFLTRLWPSGRRIFGSLGLNRCSIL